MAQYDLKQLRYLAKLVGGDQELAYDAVVDSVRWGGLNHPGQVIKTARLRLMTKARDRERERNGPKSARYWLAQGTLEPDPAPEVEDRVAVNQALAALSEEDRQVLEAYADCMSVTLLAEKLQVERHQASYRLSNARRRARRLLEAT